MFARIFRASQGDTPAKSVAHEIKFQAPGSQLVGCVSSISAASWLTKWRGFFMRVGWDFRHSNQKRGSAFSRWLAANALSPFSPKWRATGVRSASPPLPFP